MSRSLATLKALLPKGRAWTRAVGTVLHGYLEAIAQEFDRLETRAADLVREAVPSGADELLEDWERVTGANECTEGASIEARRAGVAARLSGGVPTYPRLEEVVESLGYEPTLEHWAPCTCGTSAVGDALTNDEWQHAVGIEVFTHTPEDDAALRCVVDDELHLHVIPVWTFTAFGTLLTEDGLELLTEDGVPIEAE